MAASSHVVEKVSDTPDTPIKSGSQRATRSPGTRIGRSFSSLDRLRESDLNSLFRPKLGPVNSSLTDSDDQSAMETTFSIKSLRIRPASARRTVISSLAGVNIEKFFECTIGEYIDEEAEYIEQLNALIEASHVFDTLTFSELRNSLIRIAHITQSMYGEIAGNGDKASLLASFLLFPEIARNAYIEYLTLFRVGFDSLPQSIRALRIVHNTLKNSASPSLDWYFKRPLTRLRGYTCIYKKLLQTSDFVPMFKNEQRRLKKAHDSVYSLLRLARQRLGEEKRRANMAQFLESIAPATNAEDESELVLLEDSLDISKVRDLFTLEPIQISLNLHENNLSFERRIVGRYPFSFTMEHSLSGKLAQCANVECIVLTDMVLIVAIPKFGAPRLMFPPLMSGTWEIVAEDAAGCDLLVFNREKLSLRAHSRIPGDREWLNMLKVCANFASFVEEQNQENSKISFGQSRLSLGSAQSSTNGRTNFSSRSIATSDNKQDNFSIQSQNCDNVKPDSRELAELLSSSPLTANLSSIAEQKDVVADQNINNQELVWKPLQSSSEKNSQASLCSVLSKSDKASSLAVPQQTPKDTTKLAETLSSLSLYHAKLFQASIPSDNSLSSRIKSEHTEISLASCLESVPLNKVADAVQNSVFDDFKVPELFDIGELNERHAESVQNLRPYTSDATRDADEYRVASSATNLTKHRSSLSAQNKPMPLAPKNTAANVIIQADIQKPLPKNKSQLLRKSMHNLKRRLNHISSHDVHA